MSVVTRVLRPGLGTMTLLVKGEMSWPGLCVLTGPFSVFLLSETGCEWFTLAGFVGHLVQLVMEEWDPSVGSALTPRLAQQTLVVWGAVWALGPLQHNQLYAPFLF